MFHETLSQALNEAIAELTSRGCVFTDEQLHLRDPFVHGGMAYGDTKRAYGELATLKGKKTFKYAHVTIYRAETGRYEQTNYIL